MTGRVRPGVVGNFTFMAHVNPPLAARFRWLGVAGRESVRNLCRVIGDGDNEANNYLTFAVKLHVATGGSTSGSSPG
ncbi:hypothetical protein GCM10009824_16710 [Kocuria atrinae]|uniref:Uncharacterized protein n=1 Tax=Kocuria atrinae TaxID=592377 RepID=A0ABP5JFL3_9MICC